MKILRLAAIVALLGLPSLALAQVNYPTTATGGPRAPGSVCMYFDTSSGTAKACAGDPSAGGGGGGSGDASASNQDEQTAILTTIDADTGGVALGIGGTADAAATQGSTGSVNAKLRTLTAQLNTQAGFLDGLEAALAALPQNNVLAAGTNNIGDVDVLSLPALVAGTANIGDVDVLSLPALVAGSANIGDVDVASIAAGNNNIGDVDVATLPASAVVDTGTAGTAATEVLTVQGIASMTPILVTPAANSAVNVAQVNGVTPLMGHGTTGTGSPRMTLADIGTGEYESVAASATAQALGATGAAGDYLLHLTCSPATTSPGVVTVINNSANRVAFAGGASSVSNLVPFTIVINAYAVTDAWSVTTGANISCLAVGNFT